MTNTLIALKRPSRARRVAGGALLLTVLSQFVGCAWNSRSNFQGTRHARLVESGEDVVVVGSVPTGATAIGTVESHCVEKPWRSFGRSLFIAVCNEASVRYDLRGEAAEAGGNILAHASCERERLDAGGEDPYGNYHYNVEHRCTGTVVRGAAITAVASTAEPVRLTTADVVGHWSNDTWGHMVITVVDGVIVGAYEHDEGTVSLTWREDGALVGWWSETPSRAPDADAGEVEFTFYRTDDCYHTDGPASGTDEPEMICGEGVLSFEGRWRYGTDGSWHEDWDLQRVESPVPEALSARFGDPSSFIAHP